MKRWYLTQSERAAISGECDRMANRTHGDGTHSELRIPRYKKNQIYPATQKSQLHTLSLHEVFMICFWYAYISGDKSCLCIGPSITS